MASKIGIAHTFNLKLIVEEMNRQALGSRVRGPIMLKTLLTPSKIGIANTFQFKASISPLAMTYNFFWLYTIGDFKSCFKCGIFKHSCAT